MPNKRDEKSVENRVVENVVHNVTMVNRNHTHQKYCHRNLLNCCLNAEKYSIWKKLRLNACQANYNQEKTIEKI